MRIAFCVYGIDENDLLNHAEFYRHDYELLQALGHEVGFVNHPVKLRPSYDVAFVWWWNYLWLWGPVARLLALPIVTTGVFDLGLHSAWPAWKLRLKHWGVRQSDLHLFVSRSEAAEVRTALRLPTSKVRYSPLCVDTSLYTPSVEATGPRPFTVLNIAWQRLSNLRRKMLLELLEAFALFSARRPEARLLMAGRPEDGATVLRARARELRIEHAVEILGEVTREEKVRLMRRCSLYCQVSRHEGFGLAIVEAMACGAPVLVSGEGAVPEVVGASGTYVRELSVAGILDGLQQCYERIEEKRRLAEEGVERVRSQFSLQRRRQDLAESLEWLRPPA